MIMRFFALSLFCFIMSTFDLYASHINIVRVNDMINVGTADYITNSVKRSEMENAQALVLQLDTPGGLLTATRDIVKTFLNLTRMLLLIHQAFFQILFQMVC